MASEPKFILHHLNNSRSQRILWLLEELALEYTIIRYERDPKTNLAPDALKAVHPLGRSPVLSTPDGVLAESGAIVEYLVNHYAQNHFKTPTDKKNYQDYLFWLHFAEGSMMPPLVATLVLNKAREKAKPFFIKPIVNKLVDKIMAAYYGPNMQQNMQFIEDYLTEHPWFAGDAPTGADVQMLFPLETLLIRSKGASLPAIKSYVERIHARPAYQAALAKGGQYDYA